MVDLPTETSATIPAQSAKAVRLVIVRSPVVGQMLSSRMITNEAVTFGRQVGDGVLHLEDSEVSRRHCVIEEVGGDSDAYQVRDLESRNHTFVNGHQVDTAELNNGDVIRTGRSLVLFESLELDSKVRLVGENEHLLGTSIAIARVRGAIVDVADRTIPVLILGETGSGKERVASFLHERSERKGEFVPVNCAAIPENLFESELFGHVAGAFTGANKAKDGLFVAADGGTLFLDEVGEMPMPVQAKLLRVLADGEVRPVGANASRKVDVRIVAATNVGVEEAIEASEFRGDLYARLAGWTINVPPLRNRRSDVLSLASHFLQRADGPNDATFSANAAEALLVYRWPFNVRELEQTMGGVAVRMGSRKEVEIGDLPRGIREALSHRAGEASAEIPLALMIDPKSAPDADDLTKVLKHFEGNVVHVAAFFERDRRQIYRWAESLGVDLASFRS